MPSGVSSETTTVNPPRREYDHHCLCSARMQTRPVTVTFPAEPAYLRLARIATADAASRAGLDFEEIDDVRIAVSELCSMVSVDAGSTVTLEFQVSPGVLTVEGESRTGAARITPNELSAVIVAAVTDQHSVATDEGVTRFLVTKRARAHDV
jgi:serine/threonine-protein kinase RsbW